MSKVRIGHLFVAACVISSPYFGFMPPAWADPLKPLAPHAAGSMVVNVFWPQGTWLVKRAGSAVARLCSLGFDTVLEFVLNRVDQLRSRRAEAGQQIAPLPVDETEIAAAQRPAAHLEGPAAQVSDDAGTA
jgi:hypothetical protein